MIAAAPAAQEACDLLATFRRDVRRADRQADGSVVIWQAGQRGGLDLSVDNSLPTGDWRAICHQPRIGKAVVVSGYATPEEAAVAAFEAFMGGVGA